MMTHMDPDQQAPQRIRVLIADDHAAMRLALTVFLQAFEDLELVGAAVDGAEAIRRCSETTRMWY
ncbi:MAG: hypothetical protein KKA73_01385 [Chloroflexi bacterium]|nr:hypothetical protein [Chloroflexota bacterium]MBU1746317.1 hypothetical protein [Chloroflexota bacterium]